MTTKDVYRFILKGFGIYFFVSFVVSSFTTLYYNYLDDTGINQFFYSLVSIAVVVLVSYTLVFKTEQLIRLLRLDSNHDEPILRIQQPNSYYMFRLILVFIGLGLVLYNVIEFITNIYYLLETYIPNKVPPYNRFNKGSLVYTSVSIFFGLFITLNASKLALWLNNKSNHIE